VVHEIEVFLLSMKRGLETGFLKSATSRCFWPGFFLFLNFSLGVRMQASHSVLWLFWFVLRFMLFYSSGL
jgi:hypothetical protein